MFILTSSPIHPSIHPSIHYFVRHTCSKHPSADHFASCYETCNELYDIYAKLINKYLLIICYVLVFLGSEVQQWIRRIIPPLIELLYSNSSGPWTQPFYKTVWERITTNINNEIPMLCSVNQSCLTPCDPMNCSPPGSSVHGILQARILEWVVVVSSRRSCQPASLISNLHWQAGSLTLTPAGKSQSTDRWNRNDWVSAVPTQCQMSYI